MPFHGSHHSYRPPLWKCFLMSTTLVKEKYLKWLEIQLAMYCRVDILIDLENSYRLVANFKQIHGLIRLPEYLT